MNPETVVIVGVDLQDAQSIAMTRRHEDRNRHIVLVSMNSGHPWQRIQGLRVNEYVASPRAIEHPRWPDTHDALARSQSMIGVIPQ